MRERDITVTLVDTETTGLKHRECHIIQLAYIKIIQDRKDPLQMRVVKEIERKWLLPDGVIVPANVAALNGYSEEVWAKEAIERRQALREFVGDIEWSSFGGQNAPFDWRFVDEELYRQKMEWPRMANYSLFSVDVLARPLMLRGMIQNVKQETLCAFFGMEAQTHDALNDIRQALDIYRKLLQIWIGNVSEETIQDVVNMKLQPLKSA